MEEKSKGFSLRQKKSSRRPPISAPQQVSSTSNPSVTTLGRVNGYSDESVRGKLGPDAEKDTTRHRPKLGGGTSDLVKRRYSTRFTNLPDFNNGATPPVPAVPGSSNHLTQQSFHSTSLPSKIDVDLVSLRDQELQAEKYATKLLSDASNQELREYQASLQKIKNRTSANLQQNVYQNRTQFIKISKEADKLKDEMRTLRNLMSELTASLGQASTIASLSETRIKHDNGDLSARKHVNRSSVANLEAMWNVQLHALWKNVEGSQKFLPAVPGRHILHESGYWVELDAATWKARRPAHIFLLNDHLLVGSKKRKRTDPNANLDSTKTQKSMTKLVADRCWPLQDIDMIDITSASATSDREEMSNAISIRYGNESFTYRSDKQLSTQKANLLLAFRRAADELRRSLRADADETKNKAQGTTSYLAPRDPVFQKSDIVEVISDSKDRPETLIEVDGKHQNFRWIEGQIDELDSEIALQRFEDAVRHIEKLRRIPRGHKSNIVALELITAKVDERAGRLAEIIIQRLVDTHSYLKATQMNVAWLVRLGFDDSAREEFLSTRSNIIAKRHRQILFEGNLHHHIFQISFVYFTLMRNTISIYQQCFPLPTMSACVKWAKEHLDNFNKILVSQLSNVQRDSMTWRDSIKQAQEHAQMIDEVGLDFKGLVGLELEDEVSNIAPVAAADEQ